MEEFQVKILASDHPFYEGKCYSLVIPTLRGLYGIHAHHSNMITAIIPATLLYQIVPAAPLEAALCGMCCMGTSGELAHEALGDSAGTGSYRIALHDAMSRLDAPLLQRRCRVRRLA